jgi:hypothetical protein
VDLLNCAFEANSANSAFSLAQGGAIWNAATNVARINATNCLFAGNTALGGFAGQGGAIYNGSNEPSSPGSGYDQSGDTILLNCTFSGNIVGHGAWGGAINASRQ